MNLEETKLIAEYIGRKGKQNPNLYTFKGVADLLDNDIWYKLEDAKFHKDWNWLMIVVEQIETSTKIYECQTNYNNDEFGKWSCVWFTLFPRNEILGKLDCERFETKIEAVYHAVLEYVKLHNSNKSK